MWSFDLHFLNSANLRCCDTDISKYSESPLEFEITTADCVLYHIDIKQICIYVLIILG